MPRLPSKPPPHLHLPIADHYTTSSLSATTTTTTATITSSSYFSSSADRAPYCDAAFAPELTPLPSAPREFSTRIQLQKQRLQRHYSHQLVLATAAIPGIKTSAAFFASLRTNLRLHAAPQPLSPASTPNSLRASVASLPPPSPLSAPVMTEQDAVDAVDTLSAIPDAEDPLADVPELTTFVAPDDYERFEGLKLVADSVAQQRNAANRALIFHPLNATSLIPVIGLVYRVMSQRFDALAAFMTCMGIVMTAFLACRYATQPYLNAAESINWDWAGDVDVLVTKFGDEVIAALLIEWVSGDSKRKGKKAWRGVIKGWTVKLRYRKKGVGIALLEDAVKEAQKKGAEALEFAEDHANSTRALPKIYNGRFDREDLLARETLERLMEASPVRGKKK